MLKSDADGLDAVTNGEPALSAKLCQPSGKQQPIVVSTMEPKNASTIPVAIIYSNQQQLVQPSMLDGTCVDTNVPQIMYTITTPAKVVNGNFELSTTNPALNPQFVITQL